VNVVCGNQFRAGSPAPVEGAGWGLLVRSVPGRRIVAGDLVSIPCIVVHERQ